MTTLLESLIESPGNSNKRHKCQSDQKFHLMKQLPAWLQN